MRIPVSLVLILALLVGGCADKRENQTAKKPAQESSESSAAPRSPEEKGEGGELDVARIPDKLRHDAFRYLGLGRTEPIKLQMTMSGSDQPQTGTQTAKLIRLTDDEAIFRVERDGDLGATLGSDELAVRADGVYMLSSTIGTLESESIQMPAKIEPGVKWNTTSSLTTSDGRKVRVAADNQVLPEREVATPAGKFEAIVVRGSGPSEVDGQKGTMKTESFYVLDKGPVKLVVTRQVGNDPPVTITIERVP